MKTSENQGLSDLVKEYRNGTLVLNSLSKKKHFTSHSVQNNMGHIKSSRERLNSGCLVHKDYLKELSDGSTFKEVDVIEKRICFFLQAKE